MTNDKVLTTLNLNILTAIEPRMTTYIVLKSQIPLRFIPYE